MTKKNGTMKTVSSFIIKISKNKMELKMHLAIGSGKKKINDVTCIP